MKHKTGAVCEFDNKILASWVLKEKVGPLPQSKPSFLSSTIAIAVFFVIITYHHHHHHHRHHYQNANRTTDQQIRMPTYQCINLSTSKTSSAAIPHRHIPIIAPHHSQSRRRRRRYHHHHHDHHHHLIIIIIAITGVITGLITAITHVIISATMVVISAPTLPTARVTTAKRQIQPSSWRSDTMSSLVWPFAPYSPINHGKPAVFMRFTVTSGGSI